MISLTAGLAMAVLRLRRRVGTYLLFSLIAAALIAVALTLWNAHRLRLTEEITAELRRLGVHVAETIETDARWASFTRAVGLSSGIGLFERTAYDVRISGTPDAAEAFRSAARLPDLVVVRVLNAPNFDDNALDAVRGCTELKWIGLSTTGVTDAGLRHLRHCRQLESVEIDDCPVTDEGIRFLCGLPSIQSVACSGFGFTEVTLRDLVFTGPAAAAAPQVGQPLTITGGLSLKTPLPAGTRVEVRIMVVSEDNSHAAPLSGLALVKPDAANQAKFSLIVRNRGVELQPGRNAVYVNIELPLKPVIIYRFGPSSLVVKPDAR
jgi:hypothetical protein